ncbi:UDP-glucuronic acid decarboxylase 1-like [Raphanus sativus]|uniref:UDP-glucuronic acid decarboxylase 1-like n=1 Tax=Raphanus sativus TaxID=3726 RepID=A0A9W3CPL5_RAPSA|nr:UDP-glucuronic acid decarboxylase 1-like [Raphanus sativus]
MDYHRGAGVEVRIARIFNTYGPRMCLDDGRVVSNFVAQAIRKNPMTVYGDGKQTRSFQYVSDLVDGLVALMEHDHIGPGKSSHNLQPAYYNFGVLYSEMMQYDSALGCYEKAAIERPMYAEAY